jgi:hypothetical protein
VSTDHNQQHNGVHHEITVTGDDDETQVLNFLQSMKPPMDHLQCSFLKLGINSRERLQIMSGWSRSRLVQWADAWADRYNHQIDPFEREVVVEALTRYGNMD